jgi:hypothetical protein
MQRASQRITDARSPTGPWCCCCQESPSTFYLYLVPGQLVVSSAPQQQRSAAAAAAVAEQEDTQLGLLNPITAMGGLAAFRNQLAAHLATYAASGGAEPWQVLQARKAGARSNSHFTVRLQGAVMWYPVQDMAFVGSGVLPFPACVLQGWQQPASKAPIFLHVLIPATQPAGSDAGSGSGPMPGRLQLPGVWQEVMRLEVTLRATGTGPHLYRPGGWGQLQHLQDHFMLALSAVSGSSQCPCL